MGLRAGTALAAHVTSLCKEYLHHPGGVRDMSALLLGRLLTRPDMKDALGAFLTWSQAALQAAAGVQAPFLVPGERGIDACHYSGPAFDAW